MTGKTIIPKVSIPIFVLAIIFFAVGPTLAGGRNTGSLRGDVTYTQFCAIPYNINDYGYTTGLHFVTGSSYNVTIRLGFFCGGDPYAVRDIVVPPEGITNTAQGFLPAGYKLRFPTLIYAYMETPEEGSEDISFWATQFLFTGSGFSHQTFESHEYND